MASIPKNNLDEFLKDLDHDLSSPEDLIDNSFLNFLISDFKHKDMTYSILEDAELSFPIDFIGNHFGTEKNIDNPIEDTAIEVDKEIKNEEKILIQEKIDEDVANSSTAADCSSKNKKIKISLEEYRNRLRAQSHNEKPESNFNTGSRSSSSDSSNSDNDSRNKSSRSRSRNRSRNRIRSSTRSRTRSKSSSRSRYSHSRSRRPDYSRHYDYSRTNRYDRSYGRKKEYFVDNRETRNRDKQRATEERRVVYVGRLSQEITRTDLQKRFEVFGHIIDVEIRRHDNGGKYGFVTFKHPNDAYRAIEHGNDNSSLPQYDLFFGGRRTFCATTYVDLDATTSSRSVNNRSELDNRFSFDDLLKQALDSLKKRKD